jgi:hypothetical protein
VPRRSITRGMTLGDIELNQCSEHRTRTSYSELHLQVPEENVVTDKQGSIMERKGIHSYLFSA